MIHESMFIKSTIKKEPMDVRRLTDAALCKAYQNGSQDAANRLLKRHMASCLSAVNIFRWHPVDQEDLLQEAQDGLLHAARKYDAAMGYQFFTYSVWWMKAFITRYIRKHVRNIRLPDNVHISVARALRGERVGKADPKNERIDALAMRDFRATSTISIETPTHEGHHLTYSDTIAGGDQREEMQLDTDLLRRHIADLPEKQRRVIRMLFGIDSGECATLRDVGDSMGVSYERIRQIKDDALDTLKKRMSREDWV